MKFGFVFFVACFLFYVHKYKGSATPLLDSLTLINLSSTIINLGHGGSVLGLYQIKNKQHSFFYQSKKTVIMNVSKALTTLCLAYLVSFALKAQTSGIITYQETIKLDIDLSHMATDMDLSEMFPSTHSLNKQLLFDQNVSVYSSAGDDSQDREISTDDGSIQISIVQSDSEEKLYMDYKNKICLDQKGFMGKSFIVENEVDKIKWKITPEKVKYLDYECIKATALDGEGKEVVAWFAPAIPVQVGPHGFGQLPGAILMLSKGDKELEIKATSIDLKAVDKIEKPDDGQKVSPAEFDKIVEEKQKEMEKEYGGKTIMFRG